MKNLCYYSSLNPLDDPTTGQTNYTNAQYGYPALKKFGAPGMYAGDKAKAYS